MAEKEFLMIVQIVLSVLLTLSILTQDRGSGLSATFGGEGGFHSSRRGAEKVLYYATIVLSILFLGNAALFLFL